MLDYCFLYCIQVWVIAETNAGLVHPQVQTPTDQIAVRKAPANDEQKLLRYLLRSYDKSVRPVFNASHVVTIAVGLTLTHIFNIDEKNQVLSLNVWLEQEWTDERIQWDYKEFGGLKQLTVPTRFLWTPDIVLYNNAEDFSSGIMQTNVAMYSDGLILWAPPVKFRSTCQLDVTFFPFDEQICHLRFGSWIYDGLQVNVRNRSASVSLDSYTDHGEWAIVDTYVSRRVNYYACCENVPFPELEFTLHIRRRTLFYMYNIIIPCIMLSILTLMQFWLPCESGEKVTLGLTVVLAYSVFSFNIGENIPETSDVIPLIAIYIMCIMSLSSISVMMSVIILNLRHGGEHRQRVPWCLRLLAFSILGPILCFKRKDRDPVQDASNSTVNDAFNALSAYILTVAAEQQPQGVNCFPDESPSPSPSISQVDETYDSPCQEKRRRSKAYQLIQRRVAPLKLQRRKISGKLSAALSHVEPKTSGRLQDIVGRTAKLMQRFERENDDETIMAEWQRAARIFDQLFFWIVFVLTLTITFGMMIMGTLGHRQWTPLQGLAASTAALIKNVTATMK